MDRDLFPWILGGALITTGAIAAAIQFGGHSPSIAIAPRSSPAPDAVGGSGLAVSNPKAQSGSTAPVVPPPPSTAQAPTAAPASELPTGQVWECVVNGQKEFSDKRCGNGASVMQLGDVNVMDEPTAPPQPIYGRYPPGYGGPAYPSPAPPYPDDQDDADSVASDVYPGQQIIVARERARRERLHRLDSHAPPSSPSRGAAGPRNPR
jgi:hypothetical protein